MFDPYVQLLALLYHTLETNAFQPSVIGYGYPMDFWLLLICILLQLSSEYTSLVKYQENFWSIDGNGLRSYAVVKLMHPPISSEALRWPASPARLPFPDSRVRFSLQ